MIAVVTGGCSGLGLEFTKSLFNRGYKVYALYNKSVSSALELENMFDNCRCIKCDITNEEKIEEVLFNIGEFDLLINNASISKDNNYQEKTKKEFMSVLETNLVGTFLMIKHSLNYLSNKGIIINISSNNSLDCYKEYSMDYDASKAGVNILTKDFALVLKNTNKKIVSICPGWINTDSVLNMNKDELNEALKSDNQKKLIDKEMLANNIIDNINFFKSGDIIEIKDLEVNYEL